MQNSKLKDLKYFLFPPTNDFAYWYQGSLNCSRPKNFQNWYNSNFSWSRNMHENLLNINVELRTLECYLWIYLCLWFGLFGSSIDKMSLWVRYAKLGNFLPAPEHILRTLVTVWHFQSFFQYFTLQCHC